MHNQVLTSITSSSSPVDFQLLMFKSTNLQIRNPSGINLKGNTTATRTMIASTYFCSTQTLNLTGVLSESVTRKATATASD